MQLKINDLQVRGWIFSTKNLIHLSMVFCGWEQDNIFFIFIFIYFLVGDDGNLMSLII